MDFATRCRICDRALAAFMSFGRMPIANGFRDPADARDEYFFDLAPAFCEGCGMMQLVEQPTPDMMFHDNYAFFTGTSRHMQMHFTALARVVIEGPLQGRRDPFVVEIGSNDGSLLSNFKAAGVRHLGVEPSSNVADVARGDGIDTLVAFFDSDVAGRIVDQHGRADIVLAANVMCHIPGIAGVADGVAKLLKPDGIFMFEDPYLGSMLENTSYDQIYDEHVFMFSVTSVMRTFARHGFALIDAEQLTTHGGSMRYTLALQGSRAVSPRVEELLARERARGLEQPQTYDRFRQCCERSRERLMRLLDGLRAQGRRVTGYGATSKSTTVINYCGITPDHVAFISDTTLVKQGRLSPGAHIPVRPHEDFSRDYPDYALLFAWNHEAEIRAKEQAFIDGGGRFIFYVPDVRIGS